MSQHPEGWTFEEETEMRTELAQEGIPISRAPLAASIDDVLRAGQREIDTDSTPAMIQSAHVAEVVEHSLEVEAVLLELTARSRN